MKRNISYWRYGLLVCTALLGQATAANVKIATVSPVASRINGKELKNATALALMNRAHELRAVNLDVALVPFDDEASAKVGRTIASDILADGNILGVVGALNSSVTTVLGENLASSGLAIITPTSTNDDLTSNKWQNFFRMVAPDRAQVVAAAQYMKQRMKANRVFVLSDNTQYGNELSEAFMEALKRQGISSIRYAGASTPAQIAKVVSQVKAAGVDAVYYGGTDVPAVQTLKALRAAGVTVPFMGGDGFDTTDFPKNAGNLAHNVIFTTVFGPLNTFDNTRIFQSQYKKQYGAEPSGLAVYAFDSANVLIEAIIQAAKTTNGVPTRPQVVTALRNMKLGTCLPANCPAITGRVSFANNGERSTSRMLIMKYDQNLKPVREDIQVVQASDINP